MGDEVMKKKIIIFGLCLVMCFVLVGCASSDYKEAVELQKKGQYQQALELYNGIKEYEDSTERIQQCKDMIDAIESYNGAKKDVEEKNASLDSAIANAEAVIAEKKTPLDESLIQTLETAVSDAKSAKIDVQDMPKTANEINAETEKLNAIDYSSVLDNLEKNQTNLENSIKQYELVNNPKEKYVIKCLKKVNAIKDISSVTEDNDPNGKLNKPGGYTAQVYFSCKWVDQSDFSEKTIIDKGTDCGGSIEVYSSIEDAEKRKDYLATFDGTIFASGSHTVIGTVLVRTSDKLPASKQKKLEKQIIKQLTKLDK